MAWLIRPIVEAYGQATLQFDEAEKTYFIQTENSRTQVNELHGFEAMASGLPVTYYQTRGCAMRVYSGFVSEDDLRAMSLHDMRKGCFLGAMFVSIVLLLGIIDKHRWKANLRTNK